MTFEPPPPLIAFDKGFASAAQLREEFDRTFQQPPRENPTTPIGFVLVELGKECFALATEGLSGIEHATAVVAMPSPMPALLGVAGLRGAMVPVFGMAALLGRPAEMSAAWKRKPVFAVMDVQQPEAAGHQRMGFAFDRLRQFVQVQPDALLASDGGTVLRDRNSLDQDSLDQDSLYKVVEPRDLVAAVTAAGRQETSGDATR